MRIETLTTGDELLEGTWRDEHSRYLAQIANEYGCIISRFNTVGDHREDLTLAIREISQRAELCIMTGGLGPTNDDLTLEVLASASGSELKFSPVLWDEIISRFPQLRQASQSNKRQARTLSHGVTLFNPVGTAPAVQVVINGCQFFAFPGVTNEMKACVHAHLLPWLEASGQSRYETRVLRVAMTGESVVSERINQLTLSQDLRIGYQALGGEHRIKLRSLVGHIHQQDVAAIIEAVKEFYLNDQDVSLVEQLVETAKQAKLTLGCAESCTGGAIGSSLTSVAGVSSVFYGSLVTYSNRSKAELLGVPEVVLNEYGAVSEQCALEMAAGARKALDVDWAVSVTGIAGPGGGTEIKPVGMVCFAWSGPNGTEAKTCYFKGNRERVRARSVTFALFGLLRRIEQSR